jgi:hypothetical protein
MKQLNLNLYDDGRVEGVVVGSPADAGGGSSSSGGGEVSDDAVQWVPSDDSPYQKRGTMRIGQLYYFDGSSMPGYGSAISVGVQPNVQAAIGGTPALEAGAQMATTPVLHTLEGGFRVYFKAVAGSPDPTEATMNVTPYNVP